MSEASRKSSSVEEGSDRWTHLDLGLAVAQLPGNPEERKEGLPLGKSFPPHGNRCIHRYQHKQRPLVHHVQHALVPYIRRDKTFPPALRHEIQECTCIGEDVL